MWRMYKFKILNEKNRDFNKLNCNQRERINRNFP